MLILRNQNRILIGLLLLIVLFLAGAAAAWYRFQAERDGPPAGARLVGVRGPAGA
ncbi:MAG: hypothetical protein ACOY94_05055 [Bacillota bacterium]